MKKLILLRLSVFCPAQDDFSTKKTASLMTRLKSLTGLDLLPSVIKSQTFDVNNGTTRSYTGMSFSTTSHNILLCF